MGASIFHVPETPEETKVRSAGAVIELASLLRSLLDDPKTLQRLAADAAASVALTDAQRAEREQALKNSADAAQAIAAAKKAHEQLKADSELAAAAHRKRVDEFEKLHDTAVKTLDAQAAAIEEKAKSLADGIANHVKAVAQLSDDRALLDGRVHELAQREQDMIGEMERKAAGLKLLHDAREAKLAKREAALDIKAKKFEELKTALKE